MKHLLRLARWVIAFYTRPEAMGFPIWASPLIMPAYSPYWRLFMTEDRPIVELACETIATPQPARDPVAVARRRAQFRLVSPLQEVRP